MKLSFFLPTKEDWCGTYEGGYVEVVVINGKRPVQGRKWQYGVRIIFQGNDDLMWTKNWDYEDTSEVSVNAEFLKAIALISKVPLPVKKKYLKSIGFETE